MACEAVILPDCGTCYKRDSCAEAAPEKFCAMWQSREPVARDPDPNELWNQGEEVCF